MRLLVILTTLLLPALATASGEAEPTGFRELAALYRIGHESGDFRKISELICWDRVDAQTRSSLQRNTVSEFGRPISSISFEQLPEDAFLEYEQGGVTYRPNLSPIGHLVVRYPPKPSDPGAATASHYLIGRKAGVLRITTAAPVEEE
jgi:hypothetical protein